MKKRFKHLLSGIAIVSLGTSVAISISSCSLNNSWTILCYLTGSDFENDEGNRSMSLAINSMLKAKASDNVKIIAVTGGSKSWGNEWIDNSANNNIQYWQFVGSEHKELEHYTEQNMGKAACLEEFLKYGISNFESKHYGLCFFDHGAAYRGLNYDNTYGNDRLELEELSEALAGSNQKFDFTYMNNCLMANLDVANVMAPHTQYLVASEEPITYRRNASMDPDNGYPGVIHWNKLYDYIIDNPSASGLQIGKAICSDYFDIQKEYRVPAAMSIIDESKIAKVMQSFNEWIDWIGDKEDNPNFDQFRANIQRPQIYGSMPLVDIWYLSSFFDKTSEITTLQNSVDSAVLYNDYFLPSGYVDSSYNQAHGLSTFVPLWVANQETAIKQYWQDYYDSTTILHNKYQNWIQSNFIDQPYPSN